ncbi:hypothetical protein Ahia01_001203700, partial [Argonauta hians]
MARMQVEMKYLSHSNGANLQYNDFCLDKKCLNDCSGSTLSTRSALNTNNSDNFYECLSDVSRMSEKFQLNNKIRHEGVRQRQQTPISDKYQSLTLIDQLQQIRSTRKVINEVGVKKLQRIQHQEAEQILSCTKIEENMAAVSSLVDYLKMSLQKKQLLLTCLQRRKVDNAIRMEVKHHSTFVKVFSHYASFLQNLTRNLDYIDQISSTKLSTPEKLPEIISSIESNLAQINANYHLMSQINE